MLGHTYCFLQILLHFAIYLQVRILKQVVKYFHILFFNTIWVQSPPRSPITLSALLSFIPRLFAQLSLFLMSYYEKFQHTTLEKSYNEFLCTYHLAPQLSTHSQKPGVSKHLCYTENDVIYLNLINLASFVFPLCLQMIGFPSELCKFIYYHIFKHKLEHSKGKYVIFINFYLLNLKIVVKYIYHGVYFNPLDA